MPTDRDREDKQASGLVICKLMGKRNLANRGVDWVTCLQRPRLSDRLTQYRLHVQGLWLIIPRLRRRGIIAAYQQNSAHRQGDFAVASHIEAED
ncbi:hypothetical protein D3C84_844410 [compost metagenome]